MSIRPARIACLIAAVFAMTPAGAHADTVRLTDGAVIRGTIRKTGAETVDLETLDGVLTIKRERIASIDYGPNSPDANKAPQAASGSPSPALPLPGDSVGERLGNLRGGDRVRITTKDSSAIEGTVIDYHDSILWLNTTSGKIWKASHRIASVELLAGSSGGPQERAAETPTPPRTSDSASPRSSSPAPEESRRTRRLDRLAFSLDLFGPANAGDALKSDLQAGANALAGAGYAAAGVVETKTALGGRLSYFVPASPRVELAGSLGYIAGPGSKATVNVSGGGRTATLSLDRSVSFFRFLLEERTRFPLSDHSTFSLGGGLGFAAGYVSQSLTCAGSACASNGATTKSYGDWNGFSWEFSADFIYHNLLAGFRFAGFPGFAGNDNLSKIAWTPVGFAVGATF